jgi:phosphate:Na+ symporter
MGAVLRLFSKNRKHNYIGEVVLGLGLLFFGLVVLREAFDPLKDSEEFRQLFLLVRDYKLLGVLIGTVLTIIVQGSAATLAITLALASSGLISFEASVALILGENIGTTITANISAIGTSLAAKRAAFSHFLFNVIGVIYILIFFPLFLKLIESITPGDADFVIQTQAQAEIYSAAIGSKPYIARYIANAHTLFNIVNTLLFLPFIGVLANVSSYFIRGREDKGDETLQIKFIDDRVLNTPPVALGQARRETRRMAQIALDMVAETNRFLDDGDMRRLHDLERKEQIVDSLQREITNFLTKLSQKSISADSSVAISSLMNMVNDLERIGDHCVNLWRLNTRKLQGNIKFSHTGVNEVSSIADAAYEFLSFVLDALDNNDKSIGPQALALENRIDGLEESLRMNHISRLNTGECAVQPGLIFIDMLQAYEKIGDHTFKVAQAVLGKK